jgi:hypothetical protein
LKDRESMNEAGLDQFNTFAQCLSLALIVLPTCYYIYYRDRLKRERRIGFNGRWRIWYSLYLAVFVFALVPPLKFRGTDGERLP